ncbi:uncharacterized protein [Narcine bancroftii]|uniref:uncharacterized protein n=1 Tax=Narcine bancroftii TaxID=1343680 RepID=UPI0038321DD0
MLPLHQSHVYWEHKSILRTQNYCFFLLKKTNQSSLLFVLLSDGIDKSRLINPRSLETRLQKTGGQNSSRLDQLLLNKMKIFIITLLLFASKGFETNALPVSPNGFNSENLPEPILPLMNIQNLSAILANFRTNLTEVMQKKFESVQLQDQTEAIKDKIVFILSQMLERREELSQIPSSSIAQQLEVIKRNFSQWSENIAPAKWNSSQIFQNNFQEEMTQKVKHLHQLLLLQINTYQESLLKGWEEFSTSIAPRIHELKKLALDSETIINKIENFFAKLSVGQDN